MKTTTTPGIRVFNVEPTSDKTACPESRLSSHELDLMKGLNEQMRQMFGSPEEPHLLGTLPVIRSLD